MSRVTATTGTPRSAAAWTKSPARTPRPPAYVGIAGWSATSIEKYATMGHRDQLCNI
jgi:hypothetical protein